MSDYKGAVRLHSLSALQDEFTSSSSNGLFDGYLEEIGLCNQIGQVLYLGFALQNTYYAISAYGVHNICNERNLR